jgi:hypothetical protein
LDLEESGYWSKTYFKRTLFFCHASTRPKGILRSIHTTMANGIDVKVVFVQNRNKKKEWLQLPVQFGHCVLDHEQPT